MVLKISEKIIQKHFVITLETLLSKVEIICIVQFMKLDLPTRVNFSFFNMMTWKVLDFDRIHLAHFFKHPFQALQHKFSSNKFSISDTMIPVFHGPSMVVPLGNIEGLGEVFEEIGSW